MSVLKPMPTHLAKVIEVVFVHALRGDGSKENPERFINLYFSRDGDLLACHDPQNGPPDSFLPLLAADETSADDAPASFAIGFDPKKGMLEVLSGRNDSRISFLVSDLALLTEILQSFDGKTVPRIAIASPGEVVDMSPYCGDDYDRVGCTVSIAVTAARYSVVVRAPNGAVIESWGEHEPGVLAQRLAAWCQGRESAGQLSES